MQARSLPREPLSRNRRHVVAVALSTAAPLSLHYSPSTLPSVSLDGAEARVGRPLTPMSVAGVNRRVHRRAPTTVQQRLVLPGLTVRTATEGPADTIRIHLAIERARFVATPARAVGHAKGQTAVGPVISGDRPKTISELVCGKPLLQHEPERQPGGNRQTDANSQIRQCNAHGHSSMPRRDENMVRCADSRRQAYIPSDV